MWNYSLPPRIESGLATIMSNTTQHCEYRGGGVRYSWGSATGFVGVRAVDLALYDWRESRVS